MPYSAPPLTASSSNTMAQEEATFTDTYKSIVEAEQQALALEVMLDKLDGKLDSLLDEIDAPQKVHQPKPGKK